MSYLVATFPVPQWRGDRREGTELLRRVRPPTTNSSCLARLDLGAGGLHPSLRFSPWEVSGFSRVTGAPSLLPATCLGSIPVPGSLEGVRDIPILPLPARMWRGRGPLLLSLSSTQLCLNFFSIPGDLIYPVEETKD